MQTHGIGTGPEGRGLPWRIVPIANCLYPLGKAVHGLAGQGLHGGGHGLLLGQPGVEHLFHGPSSFAKLIELHHAGAAFEGVKSPAQNGLFTQIGSIACQGLQGRLAVGKHFFGLFEKDLPQLGVGVFVFLAGQRDGRGRWGRYWYWYWGQFWRWYWSQFRHWGWCRRWRRGAGCWGGRLCRAGGRVGRGRWLYLHVGHERGDGLLCPLCQHGGGWRSGRRCCFVGLSLAGTAHGEFEFTSGFVVAVEFAGHVGLVAQHINQEAQHP